MRKAAGWQSRPVFITSTFRDMHAERDWLRERIIPELAERLRERHAHLEPIDLRWGVENLSAEDEEAKELIVLKVCLDEIERSRPFLIGLIGDRYGWVPPEGRMQTAIDEKGFRTDVQQKSVTALEIEFGVLDSPDQRRRSHFFFRDPLPYDDMPPEVAAQYSDAHSPDPGVRRYAQHLGPLKERIERELPGRVHHYSATWDADAGEVTGLDAFAEMVLEALWADLESEIQPLSEKEETTWENEDGWHSKSSSSWRRVISSAASRIARRSSACPMPAERRHVGRVCDRPFRLRPERAASVRGPQPAG